MNWNGQQRYLDHLIAKRVDLAGADKLQQDINAFRRSRIDKALAVRPIFIPLQFTMTAAAQTSPYRQTSPQLEYDVIITAIKSDNQTRDIVVRNTQTDSSLTRIGDETSLYLRADEIAGQTADNAAGQLGPFYLPAPITMNRGNRITVEMFKADATAAVEVANIVLIGIRVLPGLYRVQDDPDERKRIDRAILLRETPAPLFLKQLVNFDTAALNGQSVNLFSPEVDEPLLIRGVRTGLRYSTIELGLQGEPTWTISPTPIWGIAAEDELLHENYQWFSRPVYLHSNSAIETRRIINGTVDGVQLDAQTGNTITWICETV